MPYTQAKHRQQHSMHQPHTHHTSRRSRAAKCTHTYTSTCILNTHRQQPPQSINPNTNAHTNTHMRPHSHTAQTRDESAHAHAHQNRQNKLSREDRMYIGPRIYVRTRLYKLSSPYRLFVVAFISAVHPSSTDTLQHNIIKDTKQRAHFKKHPEACQSTTNHNTSKATPYAKATYVIHTKLSAQSLPISNSQHPVGHTVCTAMSRDTQKSIGQDLSRKPFFIPATHTAHIQQKSCHICIYTHRHQHPTCTGKTNKDDMQPHAQTCICN